MKVDHRLELEGHATRRRTKYRTYAPWNGKIWKQTEFDYPAGNVLTETENKWSIPVQLGGNSGFIWKIQLEQETELQHAPPYVFSYRKQYNYDGYGNIIRLDDLGLLGNPTDDFYTHTTYSNSLNPWRLGYPTESKSNLGRTGE